ncbi:hypothetical protein KK617_18580, partial [Nocardioides sp. ChNu-99]|nr:hypothetical protein [Nocardioides sp. ChNu-99]
MTETLVAGQNTVWGSPWCAVELPGAALVALPLGPDGRAVLGQPLGSGRGSVGLDLAGLPAAVTTVMVTALDGVAATAELLDGRGVGVVRFVPAPVGPGAAVAVVELYRRGDGWKVRALGRAYGGGPAAVEALHGVPVGPVAPAAPAPPPP